MDDSSVGEFPRSSRASVAVETAATAATAAVPIVGGPAAILLGKNLSRRLDRRREEWLRRLGQLVDELDANQIDTESDAFQDAVLRATYAAIGADTEQKLELLAAALRSVADPPAGLDEMEDPLIDRAFRTIERLRPIHLSAMQDLERARRTVVTLSFSNQLVHALVEAGWEQGLNLEAVVADLIDLALVDQRGDSAKATYGTTHPTWHEPSNLLSVYGGWLLRFLRVYDDSQSE